MARDSLLREINSIETAREMGDACSPIASLLLEELILRSLIIWWGLYRIKERGLDKAFSKGKLATAVKSAGQRVGRGCPLEVDHSDCSHHFAFMDPEPTVQT